MKFEPNDALLKQYIAYYLKSNQGQNTFVDFGKVPQEPDALRGWEAKVESFVTGLRKRGL